MESRFQLFHFLVDRFRSLVMSDVESGYDTNRSIPGSAICSFIVAFLSSNTMVVMLFINCPSSVTTFGPFPICLFELFIGPLSLQFFLMVSRATIFASIHCLVRLAVLAGFSYVPPTTSHTWCSAPVMSSRYRYPWSGSTHSGYVETPDRLVSTVGIFLLRVAARRR